MRQFSAALAWFSIEPLIQLLIVAGVIGIVWKLLQPRYAFQIRIRQGAVAVVVGKVRRQFLDDLTEIIIKENLAHGTITAKQEANRTVLRFSREFSPALQQQIRNTWFASG